MSHYPLRSLLWTSAVALVVAGSVGLDAQVEFTNNLRHDSGQDIQPVYEGWARAANGTFDLYFGYLNRNWVQRLRVPIGPNNNIQPGGPDRGQTTFFYTRTNRKVFTVNVPADFGKKELVWTLTVNGKRRTTYGHLRPDWEITPDGGAEGGTQTTKEARSNKAPTLTLTPVDPIVLPGTATLIATVSDDGLPTPRGRVKAAIGQETPPGLSGGGGKKEVPANLPWLSGEDAKRGDGLSVKWMVFRGPGDVRFEPAYAIPADGKTTTTARFVEPGEYVLRGAAQDGLLTTYQDVTVNVIKR